MRSFLIPLFLGLFATACAQDKSAQELALATLKSTVAYENEIDKKIIAEKRFYQAQLQNIRMAIGGVPTDPSLDSTKREEALKKTWLYGKVRFDTVRDGRLAAGKILSQNPVLTAGLMIEFLDRGLDGDVAAVVEARAKQQQLKGEFVASLLPIKKQKSRLAAIRKGLASLAAGGGGANRFAVALGFAKALKQVIEEADSSNGSQPAGGG
jgi:hypothetical protein